MEKYQEPTIRIFNDIITDYKNFWFWADVDCFPVGRMKEEEKEASSGLVGMVEVSFPGMMSKRSESAFEELSGRFRNFLHRYILSAGRPAYVFRIRPVAQKNRIRSYKGIQPKELDKADYIQHEFDMPDNYSIIMAVTRLTPGNIQILTDQMYGQETCSAILSDGDILSMEFLTDIFENRLNPKDLSNINFTSLSLRYCTGKNTVCRMAGDGGDLEMNLQVFTAAQEVESVAGELGRALLGVSDR